MNIIAVKIFFKEKATPHEAMSQFFAGWLSNFRVRFSHARGNINDVGSCDYHDAPMNLS